MRLRLRVGVRGQQGKEGYCIDGKSSTIKSRYCMYVHMNLNPKDRIREARYIALLVVFIYIYRDFYLEYLEIVNPVMS